MTRILYAPAAVETDQSDAKTNSPGSITSAWVRDTKGMFSPKPEAPPPEPKKEPDGKTDPGVGHVSEQPVKPAVGGDPVAAPAAPVKPEPAKGAEPKPEAVKPDAPEDWETATAPKGIPAKDFEAWKKGRKESETKLKAEIKSREDKLAEFEKKLAEAQSKPEANGEPSPDIKFKLDSQEKEITALRSALMEVDVTKDVRWKNHFDGNRDKIIARAKRVVGEQRAAEIETILKLKDEDYRTSRIEQFLSETDSPYVQSQLNIQLSDLAKLSDSEAEEFQKVKEHNDAKAAEKQAKVEQDKMVQIESFNKTAKDLTDPENGFAPYQKRPDDPAWNEAVDKRIALVKSLLTGQGTIKPEEIIRGAFDAAAMPVVLQSYKASLMQWQSEKEAYEKQIQAFTAAQPGPGGGTNEQGDPNRLKLTPDMDPTAVTRAVAQQAARQARGG